MGSGAWFDAWASKAAAFVEAVVARPAKARTKPTDPWRAFANERDLKYSPSYIGKGWLAPRERTMVGSVNGIAMRIQLGKVAKVFAKTPSIIDGKMCAYSDNMLVDVVTISGQALPDVGDEEFDAHFFLRGTQPEVADQLLTADVRQAMMRFPLGICLDYNRGNLSVTWSGDGVIDVLAVDAACDILVAACTTRVSAGVYR